MGGRRVTQMMPEKLRAQLLHHELSHTYIALNILLFITFSKAYYRHGRHREYHQQIFLRLSLFLTQEWYLVNLSGLWAIVLVCEWSMVGCVELCLISARTNYVVKFELNFIFLFYFFSWPSGYSKKKQLDMHAQHQHSNISRWGPTSLLAI